MALDEYIKALNRIAELEFDEKNNDLRPQLKRTKKTSGKQEWIVGIKVHQTMKNK